MKSLTKSAVAATFFAIIILATLCQKPQSHTEYHLDIIPMPNELSLGQGAFKIDSVALAEGISDDIRITLDAESALSDEGYRLVVNSDGIQITAGSDAGIFYARQTLLQLYQNGALPYIEIADAPRFGYRGLHLDVSRHFFDKAEIKKLLNVMALYKLNTLHLHLTDAGGWRFEVDSYPLLTKLGAFRTESDWRKWWGGGDRKYVEEGTPNAYGGYYTKDDLREIIAYAADKHIDILPEIEFPGHSEEVFAAYPELCCSGRRYGNSDFCIGNEATFTFMERVLDEVIELFPYEYIHIGGDEARKGAWKRCPKCQALMRERGLKSVDELQSYMIRRADDYLKSKGRKLIGWDEILQGGLASGATVMSWRGESGGIKAVKKGHDVIMTPNSYLYFDYYQADPRTQPYAIGGYIPIKRVYSYDPMPEGRLTADEAKHIIGVQANTWTEYMNTKEHMEYMLFPRALALSEVAWTEQSKREWQSFKARVNRHIAQLQAMEINTFTLSNELEAQMGVDTASRNITLRLDGERHPIQIRYTLDGTTPNAESPIYSGEINVVDSATLTAAIFEGGILQGEPTRKRVDYHRAIGKSVRYRNRISSQYRAGGEGALVDGYRGGLTYLDNLWQGYLADLDCIIDMGEVTDINSVNIRFMQLTGPMVFAPGSVEVKVSRDGRNYTPFGYRKSTIPKEQSTLTFDTYHFDGEAHCRYINVKARRAHGHFLFADEIVVW